MHCKCSSCSICVKVCIICVLLYIPWPLSLQSVDVQLHWSQQPPLLHGVHSVHVAGDMLRCQLWMGQDVCAARCANGEWKHAHTHTYDSSIVIVTIILCFLYRDFWITWSILLEWWALFCNGEGYLTFLSTHNRNVSHYVHKYSTYMYTSTITLSTFHYCSNVCTYPK